MQFYRQTDEFVLMFCGVLACGDFVHLCVCVCVCGDVCMCCVSVAAYQPHALGYFLVFVFFPDDETAFH